MGNWSVPRKTAMRRLEIFSLLFLITSSLNVLYLVVFFHAPLAFHHARRKRKALLCIKIFLFHFSNGGRIESSSRCAHLRHLVLCAILEGVTNQSQRCKTDMNMIISCNRESHIKGLRGWPY